MHTKLCAEAFEQTHPAGPKEMMELVTKATKHHSQLVKEAAMGELVKGVAFWNHDVIWQSERVWIHDGSFIATHCMYGQALGNMEGMS